MKKAISMAVAICMMFSLAAAQTFCVSAACEDTQICSVEGNSPASDIEADTELTYESSEPDKTDEERAEWWTNFLGKIGVGFNNFMKGFGAVLGFLLRLLP